MKKTLLTLSLITGISGLAYSQSMPQVSPDGLLAINATNTVKGIAGDAPAVISDYGQDDGAVVFYPNPVKDNLHVRFPQRGTYTVRIYNIVGEVVAEKTVIDDDLITFDVASFQNGMFFLSYEVGNKVVTKTFSKN
jgi:hypothetical protein